MGGPSDPSFLGGIPNLPVSFPKLGGGKHTWILALSRLDTTLALAATSDVFYLLIYLLRKLGVEGGQSLPHSVLNGDCNYVYLLVKELTFRLSKQLPNMCKQEIFNYSRIIQLLS